MRKPKIFKSAMAVAATVAALGGSIIPVAAEDKSTTINYVVDQSYSWTVPATVTFTQNSNGGAADVKTGTVEVKQNIIGYGKTTRIAIKSDEDFTMKEKTDASDTRTYKVFLGSSTTALAKGGSVLNAPAGTNTGSASLKFQMDSASVQKAGNYTDTLNFTATIS